MICEADQASRRAAQTVTGHPNSSGSIAVPADAEALYRLMPKARR